MRIGSLVPRAIVVLLLSAGLPGAAADVTGTVYDSVTLTPLDGAIVTQQATSVRTTSGVGGGYALAAPDGASRVIVGALKGYFNASVVVAAPASGVDIHLDPVPADARRCRQ